ncbi:Histone deacetylase 8, partial [Basidiobolus ranarum]
GTGGIDNVGNGKGLYHSVNVPLKEGLGEKTLAEVFDQVIQKAFSTYQPDAVVLQCGSDGLVGDPTGEWNLTIESIGACVAKILDLDKPTLILGGGKFCIWSHSDVSFDLPGILSHRWL